MESVEVDELDILDPAGTITSVVEGMAVVKAHELSKPLEIGYVISYPVICYVLLKISLCGKPLFSSGICFPLCKIVFSNNFCLLTLQPYSASCNWIVGL